MSLVIYILVGILAGVLNSALGYSMLGGDWQAWAIALGAQALVVLGEIMGGQNDHHCKSA